MVRKEGLRGRKTGKREDGVLLAGAHQMNWRRGQLKRKAL